MPKQLRLTLAVLAALVSIFPVANAETKSTAPLATADNLEPVVVTATRTKRKLKEVPASVTVLTAKDLATKNRKNVYEALRDTEGLDFGYAASSPIQTAPSIRGVGQSFAGSTTQVLVDGMAHDGVTSSVLAHGGLNFTPLQDVEQVEVVRGPASALYGPGVIGGVINVIPKRWKGKAGVEINAAYGSHNTQSYGVATGVAKEKFDMRISATDTRSDGFVAIPDYDLWGQKDYGARDWQDKKYSLLTNVRPNDNQEVSLHVQSYKTDGASLGGRPNERQQLEGTAATLGYRYDVSDKTSVKAKVRTTTLKQKYTFDGEDWDGVVGNRDLAYYGGRDSDTDAVQVQVDTKPMKANQLSVGYSREKGNYASNGTIVGGSPTTASNNSQVDGIFIQDEHRFGKVLLTAGVRRDRIDLSPDKANGVEKNGSGSVANVTTPRLGARYFINDKTSVYGSFGQGYLPALNSFKFVQPSSTRVDNPNLNPETSNTHEIGVDHKFALGNVRTSLYQTKYKDQITLGTDAVSGKRQWQNIAMVKAQGIEVAYEGKIGEKWQPYANYTYNKSRDYASESAVGTQSMRIAPRKWNVGVTYKANPSLATTLNARHVSGKYFNSLTPAQYAEPYSVLDLKMAKQLPQRYGKGEVSLSINNLTNKTYSEWNAKEYADKRTYTLGYTGRF
jgi:outer membrane receptor protein involved in Fe transport